jgi:hypothetical protein
LLKSIEWDQGFDPYNTSSPYDINAENTLNHKVPAGCGATAMAQIIYYWKYPRKGTGSHGYNSDYKYEFADFANTEYQYELMTDKPQPHSSWPSISTLLYHCGVAVDMDFEIEGSSSTINKTENAFETYFNYKDCFLKDETLIGWTEWSQLIKNEIDSKRPVFYRAADPNNIFVSDPHGGHAFVVDGYNSENQFHINWGWNGESNGLFSLTLLNPKEYNFSYNHKMLIGLEPRNPDLLSPKVDKYEYGSNLNTDILFYFNEPIDPSTLNNNILFQRSISPDKSFTFSYSNENKTLTINPGADFIPQEQIFITLTPNVKDLVGNFLDGDNNGTPGPSYILNITVESFNHDYSIESVSLSNSSPITGENVTVTAVIKNKGKNTEPANQTIYLFDNNNQIKSYEYLPSLGVSDVCAHSFIWTSTPGPHELRAVVSLAGDENPVND